MEEKKPVFTTLIISWVYLLLFRLVGSLCTSVMMFKDVWNYAKNVALNQQMPNAEEIEKLYTDLIMTKVLPWQNIIMIVVDLLFVALIIALCKFDFTQMKRKLYWEKFEAKHSIAYIATGFVLLLVSGILVNYLLNLIPGYAKSAEAYEESFALATKGGLAAEMIYGIIVAPIAEEFLCRGLIFSTLKKSFTPKWAIIISSLFFAYLHDNLYQGIYTFVFGLILAYAVQSTKSIWPAVIIHSSFNLGNYILDLPSILGLEEGSASFVFIRLAVILFMLIMIPIAGILFRSAFPKCDLSLKEFREPEIRFVRIPFDPDTGRVNTNGMPFPEYVKKTVEESEVENMAVDFIVAGLGNVGTKYASNRHNAGFLALDYIGIRESFGTPREKFKALTFEKLIDGKKVLFMKPQTMMNLSGDAIGEAAKFYKLPPEKVLVIYDDINFDPGQIRIRQNGSAGGHNGIKSIINNLGSEDFPRIKIGVGKLPEDRDLVSWVLSNPCEDDMDKIIKNMENVYSAAKLIINGDLSSAQQKFN